MVWNDPTGFRNNEIPSPDHIAQNINYAVKSYLVEGFLTANGVTYQKAESKEELPLPQLAEKAEAFTVLVGCWQ